MTGLTTAKPDGDTSATWNINGTFSAANYYGASYGGNYGGSTVNLNVNAGGVATLGTMYLSYAGYCNGSSATSNVTVNGILNVTSLLGWSSHGSGSGNTLNRYINVNAGGRLNATTLDLSATGQGSSYNRLLTLNGGTLANLPGTNLTVDATTPVTLTGSGTFEAEAGRSITVNGVVQSTGSLTKTGAGTLDAHRREYLHRHDHPQCGRGELGRRGKCERFRAAGQAVGDGGGQHRPQRRHPAILGGEPV